jgi:hypothetical protein
LSINIGDTYYKLLEKNVATNQLPIGPMMAGILQAYSSIIVRITVGFQLFLGFVFLRVRGFCNSRFGGR